MTGRWRGSWEPAPADRWEDAFLTGNGRHGAMVHGDPADERIIVNHHLLVCPNGAERAQAPVLADDLERMRDDILAGRAAEAVARTTAPDGALQWVRPFHPAFAVRIVRQPADLADYQREVDYRTGVVRSTWTEGGGARLAETFVSRADDVIVHRAAVLDAELSHDVWLDGARPDLTVKATAEPVLGGALLRTDVRYPGTTGLGYTGWTLVLAQEGALHISGSTVRADSCAELLLLTRVEPWAEGSADPPEPALPAGDFEQLLGRHVALHSEAYDRVELDLGAARTERELQGSVLLTGPHLHRTALLERLFDAGRYHLLSSSGLLPPRLTGLWTGSWDPAWCGAFTTDANLNLQTASAAVAALPEVSMALAAFIAGNLDDWRENAARLFDASGFVVPVQTDGLSGRAYHFNDEYPLHLWTAGANWLLHPLLDHVAVTGDEDFARSVLAPLLAETAAFYQDFLTRKDADGRLLIVPSYSPENTPAGADSPITVNAAMDIAAARHALRAAGNDTLADRLPPYLVNADGALAEWSWPQAPDNYDHRHISHLYAVWPLDEINPFDTPDLARAAHRALELRGAENDSAHGFLHTALVAARLGDRVRVGRAIDAVLTGDFFHASLMSAHYPKLHVYNADAAHTLPGVLIEALVHSTPERVVLLPAPPPELLAAGTLRGIRTRCRVTVTELSWDTRTGRVEGLLRADIDRAVDIHVGTDADRAPRRLELRAGQDTAFRAVIPPTPLFGLEEPPHAADRPSR